MPRRRSREEDSAPARKPLPSVPRPSSPQEHRPAQGPALPFNKVCRPKSPDGVGWCLDKFWVSAALVLTGASYRPFGLACARFRAAAQGERR